MKNDQLNENGNPEWKVFGCVNSLEWICEHSRLTDEFWVDLTSFEVTKCVMRCQVYL